jgi:hypothetical protein
MTDPKTGGVKTLGIRLPHELHAQFALVAQLDDLSLTDAILRAVEFYVDAKRSEPDFTKRAAEALAAIEREASNRRAAIEALLGTGDDEAEAEAPAAKPTRRTTEK